MCDYPELMISAGVADMGDMRSERLKNLIEAGRYVPQPAEVAGAMLRRRGVRALLTGRSPFNSADRTHTAPAASRRAA